MNKDQIIDWLKAMGCKVPLSQNRGGWVLSDCPRGWAHDNGHSAAEVFGVKIEPNVPMCNCFSCGYGGDLGKLLVEMKHRNKTSPTGKEYDFKTANNLIMTAEEEFDLDLSGPSFEEKLFSKKNQLYPFDEDWLASFMPALNSKIARDYLKTRNVPPEIIEAFDMRFDSDQGRICFPVRDFKNVLVGFHGRAIKASTQPRYRMYANAPQPDGHNNPIVWLGEAWVDFNKPMVVVEGPFDMAQVARVYRNITSPLFANPSVAKIERMADALDVVTILDRGKAGDLGRARFSNALPNHNVVHLQPPEHRKDPGIMTTEELVELLADYVKIDESEIIWS